MRVETEDWRPPSLLVGHGLDGRDMVAGFVTMLAAHVAVPLSIGMIAGLLAVTGLTEEAVPPTPPEEIAPPMEVIEARFVKLGRPLPKHALPQKEVDATTKAPPKASDVPNPFGKKIDLPDASVEQPRTADDLIAQLGNRADDIANKAKAREMEGDINGIEEGTETADEGDIYAGLLYNFFRHGWTVPTSIPDEELKQLKCTVIIEITADAHVGSFKISSGSGNDVFDESVRLRVGQAEGAQLPTPSEAAAPRYLGKSVSLRFLGKHARR